MGMLLKIVLAQVYLLCKGKRHSFAQCVGFGVKPTELEELLTRSRPSLNGSRDNVLWCAHKPSFNCCWKSVIRVQKEDCCVFSSQAKETGMLLIRANVWKEHTQRRVHFLETSLSSPHVEKLWNYSQQIFQDAPKHLQSSYCNASCIENFPRRPP